jgi:hypothetical protein
MSNDRCFILDDTSTARPATFREFVEFWAAKYDVPYDPPYVESICGPHTEETFRKLWLWKVGREGMFEYKWETSLFPNFVSSLEKAAGLPPDAKTFLAKFPNGGRIYRIFWMHCWYPDRFPIYDQHVHRAMSYIQGGTLDKLEKHGDQDVIKLYLDRYMPFFEEFAKIDVPFDPKLDGIRSRKADRALSSFGLYVGGHLQPDCFAHISGEAK